MLRQYLTPTRRLAALATLSLCCASAALAEPLRVHGRVGAAAPATGPQSTEQSWGVLAEALLEWPMIPELGLGIGLGTVTLTDGTPPTDDTLRDASGASGMSGSLSLQVRPSARRAPGEARAGGLWGGTSVGVMRTNGLYRMTGELTLGFDFGGNQGGLAAGPTVGWLHVFQPDTELRPEDANVLSVGLHALFDAPPPPAIVAPEPVLVVDADGDGFEDSKDECPQDPEDKDGFEDDDGCPDPDNDADGVPDTEDQCPLEAEDRDDFRDGDGCPDPDNDNDGVLDADDQCGDESEDADGFEDADGCPDLDNDADGIPDLLDQCPMEVETVNGYADEDGCPDTKEVRVVGDRIELDDHIHFWTNSTIIRRVSYPLLQRLAALMVEHPEYTHIEIHGHADARGDEGFNRRLSEGRAQAVRSFLVRRGVPPERLTAQGFGSSQPFTEATDPRSLYLNRRVEFHVSREGAGSSWSESAAPDEEELP